MPSLYTCSTYNSPFIIFFFITSLLKFDVAPIFAYAHHVASTINHLFGLTVIGWQAEKLFLSICMIILGVDTTTLNPISL